MLLLAASFVLGLACLLLKRLAWRKESKMERWMDEDDDDAAAAGLRPMELGIRGFYSVSSQWNAVGGGVVPSD